MASRRTGWAVAATTSRRSPISPLYLPYISPTSPLHLPYISPISPAPTSRRCSSPCTRVTATRRLLYGPFGARSGLGSGLGLGLGSGLGLRLGLRLGLGLAPRHLLRGGHRHGGHAHVRLVVGRTARQAGRARLWRARLCRLLGRAHERRRRGRQLERGAGHLARGKGQAGRARDRVVVCTRLGLGLGLRLGLGLGHGFGLGSGLRLRFGLGLGLAPTTCAHCILHLRP